MIPGNHDERRALRSVFSQVPGENDEEIWFHETVSGWQLIGLDTHVRGAVAGALSARMLDFLRDWLSKDTGQPKLIFLHHHPVPVGSLWLDAIALQNATQLGASLEPSVGVRALFCGHVHQEFAGHLAATPVYSVPSTAVQFTPLAAEVRIDDCPPGFRVIEVHGDSFETRVVRVPDDSA